MGNLLPRGTELRSNERVTRVLSSGAEWEIDLTSSGFYALAVKDGLFSWWEADYSIPTGIFMPETLLGCRVYVSRGDYLVASMDAGPYPENIGQIEAFSVAIRTTRELFPAAYLSTALYIEEYSLLLPVDKSAEETDYGLVYGKWLTGGINISISSFDRISKIMSWLSPKTLSETAILAGFEAAMIRQDSKNEIKNDAQIEIEVNEFRRNPERQDNFRLVGRPKLEAFLNDNIVDIVLHQEQYKRMGINFPGATILYGPPGCGKTYAVEKMAEYLGWKRFDIDSSTIASSYIHDTSKKISEVFRAAIQSAPSILVIDEMEAFLTDRANSGGSGTHHIEEVAEFLRRIPEAINKGVLVFAMTNMIDSIDPAILRRGRFDYQVEVEMPSSEEIKELLQEKFKDLPIDESVDIDVIASKMDKHPMSDVAFVLREAGRIAVKSNLNFMNNDCFMAAINQIPKDNHTKQIGFQTTDDQ